MLVLPDADCLSEPVELWLLTSGILVGMWTLLRNLSVLKGWIGVAWELCYHTQFPCPRQIPRTMTC